MSVENKYVISLHPGIVAARQFWGFSYALFRDIFTCLVTKMGAKKGGGRRGAEARGGGWGGVLSGGGWGILLRKKSLRSHETVSCTCSCPFAVTVGLQKSSKQRQNLNSEYFVSLQKWDWVMVLQVSLSLFSLLLLVFLVFCYRSFLCYYRSFLYGTHFNLLRVPITSQ